MTSTQKNIGHFLPNKQMIYDTNQNLIIPESTGEPNRQPNLVDLKVLKKSGMYSTTNKQVASKLTQDQQQNFTNGFSQSNNVNASDGGHHQELNVNLQNKVALHETNASIGTLYEGTQKARKVATNDITGGIDADDLDVDQVPKRRPVPGASKLKLQDVRNLSDDAD